MTVSKTPLLLYWKNKRILPRLEKNLCWIVEEWIFPHFPTGEVEIGLFVAVIWISSVRHHLSSSREEIQFTLEKNQDDRPLAKSVPLQKVHFHITLIMVQTSCAKPWYIFEKQSETREAACVNFSPENTMTVFSWSKHHQLHHVCMKANKLMLTSLHTF